MCFILLVPLGYYIRPSYPRLGKALMIIGAAPFVLALIGLVIGYMFPPQ